MVRRDGVPDEGASSAERWWRTSTPREAILGQLGVLVDETNALTALMEGVPDEIVHGRPFEGVQSISEMLAELVHLDRGVRRRNLGRFLSDEVMELEPDKPVSPTEEELSPTEQELDVQEILESLREAREELIRMAHEVAGSAWERRRLLGGAEVTPLEYLNQVVQYDASVLGQAAERIHESLPAGLPGFTAH